MVKYIKSSGGISLSVKNAVADYTGGGIFVFRGQLKSGEYFIASDVNFDIRLVDKNPIKTDMWDDPDWQEAHLIGDVYDDNRITMFENILMYCIDTNQYADDMEADLDSLGKLGSVAVECASNVYDESNINLSNYGKPEYKEWRKANNVVTLQDLCEQEGKRIVKYNEVPMDATGIETVFDFSNRLGGCTNSFHYYNDYVVIDN